MEKIVGFITGLGVPGLILLVAVAMSPYTGAAAIISALVLIGPGGIIGGVASLIVIALISRALGDFGFKRLFRAVMQDFIDRGFSPKDVTKKINNYPISKKLKREIIENIELYI